MSGESILALKVVKQNTVSRQFPSFTPTIYCFIFPILYLYGFLELPVVCLVMESLNICLR